MTTPYTQEVEEALKIKDQALMAFDCAHLSVLEGETNPHRLITLADLRAASEAYHCDSAPEATSESVGNLCPVCDEPMEDHKRPCGNCGDPGHAKWECVLPPDSAAKDGKDAS